MAPIMGSGWIMFAVTAVGYFALARYVVWLNDPFQAGAGFWPAAGLTAGLMLRSPTRCWPWLLAGIVVGELASNLVQGYPAVAIPWWVVGNAVEPLIGAVLVRRFASPSGALVPLRNLLGFLVFAVALGPLVGATIGSFGTVQASESLPWSEVWPRYVVGDALGVLVVAPIILTWRDMEFRQRRVEALLLAFGLAVAATAVFREWPQSLGLVAASFTLPFLMWGAVRFGTRGAAWSVFLLAEIANLANALGHGPFVDLASSPGDAVVALQVFLLVAASSAFALAALVEELSDHEDVERLIYALADTMPQLVWVANERADIRYWNRRRDAYHRPEGGEGAGWQELIHEDDLERTVSEWAAAVASDSAYEIEHRVRMADGTCRWHLTRAERLRAIGRTEWYGTSTDIHELKLAEEAKDEFIAVASHELRNPVAAVHGVAQQLRRALDHDRLTDERLADYTASLLSSSTYLARLTHELLDASRLQRGALPMHTEATALDALIEDVVASGDWPAGRIELNVERGLGQFWLDPDRARQVLTNLIDNGLKYSPAEARVVIRAATIADGTVVEVIDRGIGIPPDQHERVFTPFGRAENVGTIPGMGMGLYLAREIAERHQGHLNVLSAGSGHGTTMQLWLPNTIRVQATAEGDAPREDLVD